MATDEELAASMDTVRSLGFCFQSFLICVFDFAGGPESTQRCIWYSVNLHAPL